MMDYFEVITDANTGEQTIRPYTPEEVTSIKQVELATATTYARSERNRLLVQSDWTQLPDAPVDQTAWASYRQALRDITDQDGFPLNVEWPVAPK